MNVDCKITQKNRPFNFFRPIQRAQIYLKLRQDLPAYTKLRHLPYHEAIDRYAAQIYAPEYLSFDQNIERINNEITKLLRQIEMTVKAKVLTPSELKNLLKVYNDQINDLKGKREIFFKAKAENHFGI